MNRVLSVLAALSILVCGRVSAQTISFVNNQPAVSYTTAKYFGWLPPMATLPSDLTCAQEIAQTPEGISSNAAMNAYAPSAAELAPFYANPSGFIPSPGLLPAADFLRVNGSYPSLLKVTPSTDMIIRWAACKWGIDEDILRAQVWVESKWRGDTAGDACTGAAACTQPGFTALYNTIVNFANGSKATNNGGGWLSWGIGQEKIYYLNTLWPMIIESTAFAADFRAASIRGCINFDQLAYFNSIGADLTTKNGHNAYVGDSGDDLYRGCVAIHFLPNSWWGGMDGTGCGTGGETGALGYWDSCINPALISKPWPGGL